MAARALRLLLMHRQTLASREQLFLQPVQHRHIRRRGRRRVVEQSAQHPRAALDRAGMLAVAAHSVDRRHAEQPSARRAGRQLHRTECVAFHVGQSVVIREQTVHHDVVRLQQMTQPLVVTQEMRERLIHLHSRRLLRAHIKARIPLVVEPKEIEPLHVQPLMQKRMQKVRRARIVEQPVGLRSKDVRFQKLTARSKIAQRFVRRSTPQKIRESRGEFVRVEISSNGRFRGGRLAQIKEARR